MPSFSAENVFEDHDHKKCRSSGLADVRAVCSEEGLRLTQIRERVLEILLESHKGLGAYEILERLKVGGLRHQPPVVYRALDFLVANGFAHKLERMNAFAACSQPIVGHEPMFLICQDCKNVAETNIGTLGGAIDRGASKMGFEVTSRVVEVLGRCPACSVGINA